MATEPRTRNAGILFPIASSRVPLAMAPAVFTQEQEEIINTNHVAKTIDEFRNGLPKDIG